MQEWGNSIANALELRLSCINPSIDAMIINKILLFLQYWLETYCERAQLTRLWFEKPEEDEPKFLAYDRLKKVKVFIKDRDPEIFDVPKTSQIELTLSGFLEEVKELVNDFEFEFADEELWEERKEVFKYLHMKHNKKEWTSDLDEEKMEEEPECKTDFKVYTNTIKPLI